MYVLFYLRACLSTTCMQRAKVRRGAQVPWNWSYSHYEQPCKCYELNFSPLQEQTALNYWVISPDPGIKCYVWFGMYNCFLYIWNTHPVTNNRNLQTTAIFHLILAFCLFCETNSHVSQAVFKLTASPMLALNAWSSWFNWTLFIFYFLLGIHKFMCIYVPLAFFFCMI